MIICLNFKIHAMKTEILNYFKTDRGHAAGVALVQKYSRKLALKKQVNIHPESKFLIGVIHEELRELAEITEKQLQELLRMPIVKVAVPEVPVEAVQTPVEEKSIGKKAVKNIPEKIPAEKKASRKKSQ